MLGVHTATPGPRIPTGRVLHAMAVSRLDEDLRLRVAGTTATFTVLAVAAVALLVQALRVL